MKLNGPGREQLVQERNARQKVKHTWLHSDLIQALKGEPLSSSSSIDRSLTSASAVPRCGGGEGEGEEGGGERKAAKHLGLTLTFYKEPQKVVGNARLLSWDKASNISRLKHRDISCYCRIMVVLTCYSGVRPELAYVKQSFWRNR